MQETIEAVRKSFQTDLDLFPTDRREIEALKSKYFGRKGALAKLFSQMGKISPEDRPGAGKLINDLKQELTKTFDTKAAELLDPAERTTENVDYTLPGENAANWYATSGLENAQRNKRYFQVNRFHGGLWSRNR